jgi:uncharacterized protein YndB with AHSA1/START domain
MMIESTEQDLSVERTLELTAPVDRVWRALTEPEELARWFPDRVDQAEVKAGVDGRFVWEKHGSFAFRIEAVEPPRRLVWRWARDPKTPLDEGVTTRVEWVLEPRSDGGTTLRLCESGFVRPEDQESNDKGWDAELKELVELLSA